MKADLAQTFLHAAQMLADAMLADLGQRDPAMGASVANATAQGESLALTFLFSADAPEIELSAQSDYGSRRKIASIQLQNCGRAN